MKRWRYCNSLILLLLLMPQARHAMAQQRLVMPAALKAGDTIAIVSPSSTLDTLTVAKGCETLREWGYIIKAMEGDVKWTMKGNVLIVTDNF